MTITPIITDITRQTQTPSSTVVDSSLNTNSTSISSLHSHIQLSLTQLDTFENIKHIKTSAIKNKGYFHSKNVQWSYGFNENKPYLTNDNWKIIPLTITLNGELVANDSAIMIPNIQNCSIQLFNKFLIIKLVIHNQKVLFFKLNNFSDYMSLLSSLMVWQNLKPESLLSKWNYNNSMIYNEKLKPNDILICRFRVFGPLPQNNKVKVFHDSTNPIYPLSNLSSDSLNSEIEEGWFMAIGHLMPNGVLKLICESDGSELYSINISKLFSSEIRIIHHSIFQNPNVLFLGYINELRNLHYSNNPNIISNKDDNDPLILNKSFRNIDRILIDFELTIDLEDWFVALSSFTKIEYVGNQFNLNKLRITKETNLEILEAKFNESCNFNNKSLYCELVMWNSPWFRTANVKTDSDTSFWKENLKINLPYAEEYFKILIKSSNIDGINNNGDFDEDTNDNENESENDDEILGTCFITSDLFKNDQFMKNIPIFNLQNRNIGSLMINLSLNETHILPYTNYRIFERMLTNLKIEHLISFIEPLFTTLNLESWSIMLLDIYQSLNKEHEFLESLMKHELEPVDSLTKLNNGKGNNNFHTIFRGNSILTKTLEKYAIRVGKEYLEKLLADFINKIKIENLDCEIDPRISPDNYEQNYKNLLNYLEILWNRIFKTSNDLPNDLKIEWKKLRLNVELSVNPNDKDTSLNALSSFIFLRFLCPAILNPKLFNLSKSHNSVRMSRTLILIAKVLMVFSNRSKFQSHKDPYLMNLNRDFIEKHKKEILTYFDKITGRKMDFNEKILEMSSSKDKLILNTSKEILNELPTMPFLIDKYLNMVKLIEILDSNSLSSLSDLTHSDDISIDNNNFTNDNNNINSHNNKYQIMGFDETDFEDEDFIRNVLDDVDEEFNNLLITNDVAFDEIKAQSNFLIMKTKNIENSLIKPESPLIFPNHSWLEFVDSLLLSCKLNLKSLSLNYDDEIFHNPTIKRTIENHLEFDKFLSSLSEVQNVKENFDKIGSKIQPDVSITVNNTIMTSSSFKPVKDSKKDEKRRSVFGKLFKRKNMI